MYFDPHTAMQDTSHASFRSTVIGRSTPCAPANKAVVIFVGFYPTRAKAAYAARRAARELSRLFNDESTGK